MIGTAVSFSQKALNPFLHFSRSRNALAEILIHPSGNAAYPRIRSLLPQAMQHLLRHDGLSFQNKNLLSCPHFQIGYCRRFFDLSETKNNPENRVLSDFRGHSSLFYSIFNGFLCPFCEIFWMYRELWCYSHSFSRLSFVLFYLYFKPFYCCFRGVFLCLIFFIITRVAKYVAIMAKE